MDPLNVSEMFFSIQGEGPAIGVPSVFLRLQSCNLLCEWCDTLEVWKKGSPHDPVELMESWDSDGWKQAIESGRAHLVITGGEPLLQQGALAGFFSLFQGGPGRVPFIEVETNGTIIPSQGLDRFVGQYNVSPKLANSSMPMKRRIIPDALKWFAPDPRSSFKFAVRGEGDVDEAIASIIAPFNIPHSRVLLMPVSCTRDELVESSPRIVALCLKHGFRFSSRLQLVVWDRKTGV